MAATLRISVLITAKTVCQKRAGSLSTRRRLRYVPCYGSCSAAAECFFAANFSGYGSREWAGSKAESSHPCPVTRPLLLLCPIRGDLWGGLALS